MSKLSVNELTDETGSGAPSFPNGMSVTGAALTDPEITGGIFLGGTGSANKLDDYEEGTFTPQMDFVTYTDDGSLARYTKTGSMVFVEGVVKFTGLDTSDASIIAITGLPFTTSHKSGIAQFEPDGSSLSLPSDAYPTMDTESARVYFYDISGNSISYNSGAIPSSGQILFSAMYRIT
jgi:hypothetical protein